MNSVWLSPIVGWGVVGVLIQVLVQVLVVV